MTFDTDKNSRRPVEILQVSLTPSDFFTQNPAIDVPSDKDLGSQSADGCCREPRL